MTVILSCGHPCSVRPIEGFPIVTKDFARDGSRCVLSAVYCHSCYVRHVTDHPEDLIFEDWEMNEYLADQDAE